MTETSILVAPKFILALSSNSTGVAVSTTAAKLDTPANVDDNKRPDRILFLVLQALRFVPAALHVSFPHSYHHVDLLSFTGKSLIYNSKTQEW